MNNTSKVSSFLAVLLAISCGSHAALATTISVDASPVMSTGYESDTVGAAPAAWSFVGGTSPVSPTVTNAGSPGAYQPNNYLELPPATGGSSPVVRYDFAPVIGAGDVGTTIRFETMLYSDTQSTTNGTVPFQMVWFNTSGITSGASNSPIHTAMFTTGGAGTSLDFQYYNGSAYVATGHVLSANTWNHLLIEYEIGAGSWSATLNGSTVSGLAFNSNSNANLGIGSISFFTNLDAAGSVYMDIVPEPTSGMLLGIGGLLGMLVARRRLR
jgi:hypothetical protein